MNESFPEKLPGRKRKHRHCERKNEHARNKVGSMHVYRACNDRAERSAAGYSAEQTRIQRGEVVGCVLRSQGAEGYYRIERVFNSGEPYT